MRGLGRGVLNLLLCVSLRPSRLCVEIFDLSRFMPNPPGRQITNLSPLLPLPPISTHQRSACSLMRVAVFKRDEPIGDGELGQARYGMNVEAAHNAFTMGLNRAHANAEL